LTSGQTGTGWTTQDPKPAQTLRNVLQLKMRGLKPPFQSWEQAQHLFASRADSSTGGGFTPSAVGAGLVGLDSKAALGVQLGLLRRSATFGAIWTLRWAAPSPPNGPLTCFDQWSNWHRVDHTRSKACTNPQKRAAVKNEGFEATFSIMGAGTAPICLQGRLFNGRGLHTECSWCRIGWFGLQSCFGCSARSPPQVCHIWGDLDPPLGCAIPPKTAL
jgi:hypothetical protein